MTLASGNRAGSSGIEGVRLEDFASCECRDVEDTEDDRVDVSACCGVTLNFVFIIWIVGEYESDSTREGGVNGLPATRPEHQFRETLRCKQDSICFCTGRAVRKDEGGIVHDRNSGKKKNFKIREEIAIVEGLSVVDYQEGKLKAGVARGLPLDPAAGDLYSI